MYKHLTILGVFIFLYSANPLVSALAASNQRLTEKR